MKSHALVTARLTDSGLLVSLDDAVPEKIVSINRLLPMRTRDDFIPIVALSLRRKQDNAHAIYQYSLTIINKKIAGDARCGKRTEFSLGSSILSLAILPIFLAHYSELPFGSRSRKIVYVCSSLFFAVS